MEDVLSTALESEAIETIEQIDPIEPSDLTLSSLKEFFTGLLPSIRSAAFNIVICLLILYIGRKCIKLLHKMLDRALNRREADAGLIRFLGSVLEVGLDSVLAFMILGQLGINAASIVTVMGTALLAVGMSLQGSLSNVAGGILILLMRPFRVGHYIVSDYGEGTVLEIGLVYTRITTKDNRVLTVPNSEISNCAVTDCGENRTRRLEIVTGISYESDIRAARQVLQEICDSCEYVLSDQPVSIFVDSLGDSSVNMGLYCYCLSSQFLQAKWAVTEAIKLRFDEAGVVIPYPQVHVRMAREER